MRVERIADAKAEAISLAEARDHCKIIGTDSDDFLRRAIETARNHVEVFTRNAVVEGSYAFYFDEYQPYFKIHRPIVSIESIEYKTTENTGDYAGSLAGSDYHMNTGQGLITLNNNQMSDIYAQSNAIKITARTGQPNIGAIPADLKMVMLLLIGHLERNREASAAIQLKEIPYGIHDLLSPYRAVRL